MTDEPAQAPGPMSEPPERARIEPSAPSRKTDPLPLLYLVGFVALAGTLLYLWQNPPEGHLAPQEASRVQNLETQLAAVRGDLAKLQGQPAGPSQAAVDKLQGQLGALEARPVVTPEQVAQQVQAAARPAQDLQPLTQRIDALEGRPQVDPAVIGASVDAKVGPIGSQVQQLAARVDEAGKLGPRVDQLQARLDDAGKQQSQAGEQLQAKLDEAGRQQAQGAGQLQVKLEEAGRRQAQAVGQLQAKLDELDKQQTQTAEQLRAAVQRIQAASKLQGAGVALAAGQKLGEIPGAPPALARFANEAPPTEASLRETFDQHAAAAQRASQPALTENQDFGTRLWTRAQQAVTVRQGDRVLVGDPISGILAHAREQLDNGSLGSAVETLKQLAGPAAQAMQPWVEKAQALVQARAALAAMAAG